MRMTRRGSRERTSGWDDKKKKKRKKRKKRKKVDTPVSPPQLPDEANPVVKAPEVVQVTTVARVQMSKRRPKKNKDPLRDPQPTKEESPVEEPEVAELDMQVRECLRWEGVLEDPWAEEERLEEYRANRRRRYTAQRDGCLEISPAPSRTPLPLLSNDVP
ncbi:uncharacterized protein LOC144068202 isoform X2 [Stigmatopora argus]